MFINGTLFICCSINSSSSIDTGLNLKELGGLYITFDADKQGANSKAVQKIKDQKKEDEVSCICYILTF